MWCVLEYNTQYNTTSPLLLPKQNKTKQKAYTMLLVKAVTFCPEKVIFKWALRSTNVNPATFFFFFLPQYLTLIYVDSESVKMKVERGMINDWCRRKMNRAFLMEEAGALSSCSISRQTCFHF